MEQGTKPGCDQVAVGRKMRRVRGESRREQGTSHESLLPQGGSRNRLLRPTLSLLQKSALSCSLGRPELCPGQAAHLCAGRHTLVLCQARSHQLNQLLHGQASHGGPGSLNLLENVRHLGPVWEEWWGRKIRHSAPGKGSLGDSGSHQLTPQALCSPLNIRTWAGRWRWR